MPTHSMRDPVCSYFSRIVFLITNPLWCAESYECPSLGYSVTKINRCYSSHIKTSRLMAAVFSSTRPSKTDFSLAFHSNFYSLLAPNSHKMGAQLQAGRAEREKAAQFNVFSLFWAFQLFPRIRVDFSYAPWPLQGARETGKSSLKSYQLLQ